MSYVDQWNAIAARIRSLRSAADLYAQFRIAREEDGHGIDASLKIHCQNILQLLKTFHNSFHAILPPDAKTALEWFISGNPSSPASVISSAFGFRMDGPVLLTAFEAEMSFLLSDVQEVIRARSERAFLHLQRLLAVDADLRDTWSTAFEGKGEASCEQLGAVHLLWHGMFAFKGHAPAARTDLVFSEPIDVSVLERGVEGLVLTEWKVANEGNAAECFDTARTQARLYQQGILAGTELTGYRYVVVVSLNQLPNVPDNMNIEGVCYRHVNIAIKPRPPSVEARKRQARKG
jgi:hypothetical protein